MRARTKADANTKPLNLFVAMRSQPSIETMGKLLMDSKFQGDSSIGSKSNNRAVLKSDTALQKSATNSKNWNSKNSISSPQPINAEARKIKDFNKASDGVKNSKRGQIISPKLKTRIMAFNRRAKKNNLTMCEYDSFYRGEKNDIWTSRSWLKYSSNVKHDTDRCVVDENAMDSVKENTKGRISDKYEKVKDYISFDKIYNGTGPVTFIPAKRDHNIVLPIIPQSFQPIHEDETNTPTESFNRSLKKKQSRTHYNMTTILMEPMHYTPKYRSVNGQTPCLHGSSLLMSSSKFLRPKSFEISNFERHLLGTHLIIEDPGGRKVDLEISGNSIQMMKTKHKVRGCVNDPYEQIDNKINFHEMNGLDDSDGYEDYYTNFILKESVMQNVKNHKMRQENFIDVPRKDLSKFSCHKKCTMTSMSNLKNTKFGSKRKIKKCNDIGLDCFQANKLWEFRKNSKGCLSNPIRDKLQKLPSAQLESRLESFLNNTNSISDDICRSSSRINIRDRTSVRSSASQQSQFESQTEDRTTLGEWYGLSETASDHENVSGSSSMSGRCPMASPNFTICGSYQWGHFDEAFETHLSPHGSSCEASESQGFLPRCADDLVNPTEIREDHTVSAERNTTTLIAIPGK